MSMARGKRGTKKETGIAGDKEVCGKIVERKVQFKVKADPESEVFVAGSFNNWNPTEKKLRQNGGGIYEIAMTLPAGRHEYKFLVNGVWQVDPQCPNWAANSFGSLNSVVEVA